MDNFRPLTEEESRFIVTVCLIDKSDPIALIEMYNEFRETTFITKILEKRIEAFKLPKFEMSAILALTVLSTGNPGRAVLSLIETMEAYDKFFPEEINIDFICTNVYPFGIYTDEGFEQVWETRKENFDKGYNPIIVTR